MPKRGGEAEHDSNCGEARAAGPADKKIRKGGGKHAQRAGNGADDAVASKKSRAPLRIDIFAIGRLRSGPEAALFTRYSERLRPKLVITELREARGAPAEIKRRENEALRGALPVGAFVVALDPGGETPDSMRFAGLLERWLGQGRPVCFLIGGAEGLDSTVLARADYALSLGALTWPHFLVRAMLAEQVFRARSIAGGHPYHRSGRP